MAGRLNRVEVRHAGACGRCAPVRLSLLKVSVPLAALLCALALAQSVTNGEAGAPPQLGRKKVPPRGKGVPAGGEKGRERNHATDPRLLAQIKRDTGREVTPSRLRSVHRYATRRPDRQPVLILLSRADTACGDNANVFVYDKAQGRYLELLGLRCVKDVRPSPGAEFTNGHPDLFYNSQPPSAGWSYTAVLKFNGEFYAEHSCGTVEQRGAGMQITAGCDGRGLLSPQK